MSLIPHGEEPRICAASRTTRARRLVILRDAAKTPLLRMRGAEKKNPAEVSAGFQNQGAMDLRLAVGSVADLDATEAPAVAVPEALANHAARRRLVDIYALTIAIGRAAVGDGTTDDGAADQSGRNACGDAALCACGRRGQRTSDRCDRDEGSKCLLHVLGSPEMALSVSTGFKMTHTLYSKPAVSPKSAQQSIQRLHR